VIKVDAVEAEVENGGIEDEMTSAIRIDIPRIVKIDIRVVAKIGIEINGGDEAEVGKGSK
jgi:hypothetical protein